MVFTNDFDFYCCCFWHFKIGEGRFVEVFLKNQPFPREEIGKFPVKKQKYAERFIVAYG
jgi:hypothetical protein